MLNTHIVYVIEFFFSLCLFLNAAIFIPQAIRIYRDKSSKNVSLITFAGFNVMQLFTVLHAYLVKDKLLFLGFLLSFITCGIVTILIIYFRR